MNAAAKAIHQHTLFQGEFTSLRISKQASVVLLLLIGVLLSALSVIYMTNQHRLQFDALSQLEQKSHALEVEWGQLLLEQASLARPARVESFAMAKLDMVIPSEQQTYLLQLK